MREGVALYQKQTQESKQRKQKDSTEQENIFSSGPVAICFSSPPDSLLFPKSCFWTKEKVWLEKEENLGTREKKVYT